MRPFHALALVLALGACSSSSYGTSPPGDAGHEDDSAVPADGRLTASIDAHGGRDAPPPGDAAPGDSGGGSAGSDAGTDAGASTGGGGSTGSNPEAGVVSCYSQSSPSLTCTLSAEHCCFANYSSQHNGECTASACTWGTIDCDGPEDCPSGQHCCAHSLSDPTFGLTGYKLACQASACGPAPANQELCQPTTSSAGTCSNTRARCLSALDAGDYDLPRTLYICH